MKTTQLIPSTEHIQNAETWLGGPQYSLQRQHIPGYAGHIRGLGAESLHGKTFAKVSAECLENRLSKGIIQENDDRFSTSYKLEFNGPNLRKPQLQTVGEKILQDAKMQELNVNAARQQQYIQAPKSIEDVPPIDRLPIIGYQGFRAVFRHPIKQVTPPQHPTHYQHPLNTFAQNDAVNMLNTNNNFRKTFEPKENPVVGYTGFMKGLKSENMYGQPYRDISTQIVQNQ